MNEREQLELENYLRGFRPRTPRPLLLASPAQTWRRLAAAIALLFLCTASLWKAFHHRNSNMPASALAGVETQSFSSTITLTKLALKDPSSFEAALDARISKTLQKFDQPDSALRALAKE